MFDRAKTVTLDTGPWQSDPAGRTRRPVLHVERDKDDRPTGYHVDWEWQSADGSPSNHFHGGAYWPVLSTTGPAEPEAEARVIFERRCGR